MLNINSILYVIMIGKNAELHVSGGKIYETRMTLSELERQLGDSFIKVHRGCIVSAMAIHDITEKINLCNGESLEYTRRKKNQIIDQFRSKQRRMIKSFIEENTPTTEEEYGR